MQSSMRLWLRQLRIIPSQTYDLTSSFVLGIAGPAFDSSQNQNHNIYIYKNKIMKMYSL